MSRGKRATVGDEGGPPTPSQISKTCPSCGCDAFDALHSEPGELQRRQCKRCGEVAVKPVNWVDESLAIAGEKKEETMAKESFDCDLCDRKGFKHDQGLKHHKASKHGLKKGCAPMRIEGVAKVPLPSVPSSVREEMLGLLKQRKEQAIAAVVEIDKLIETLEG